MPQSRKGPTLHLLPRKRYGPQKTQSDPSLSFWSESVFLSFLHRSVGDEAPSPKHRTAPPLVLGGRPPVCGAAGVIFCVPSRALGFLPPPQPGSPTLVPREPHARPPGAPRLCPHSPGAPRSSPREPHACPPGAPEKLPEVTGTSQGNPGFPAATLERHRESFFNPS